MVRLNWVGPVVLGLMCVGWTWGQAVPDRQRTPASKGAHPTTRKPKTIVVREPGKPAQRCRILNKWKTPQGTRAYQVQSLTSGEFMTLVVSPHSRVIKSKETNGKRMRAATTRIYHWGKKRVSPKGAPVPPQVPVSTRMPVRTVRSTPKTRAFEKVNQSPTGSHRTKAPGPIATVPVRPQKRSPLAIGKQRIARTGKAPVSKSRRIVGSSAASPQLKPAPVTPAPKKAATVEEPYLVITRKSPPRKKVKTVKVPRTTASTRTARASKRIKSMPTVLTPKARKVPHTPPLLRRTKPVARSLPASKKEKDTPTIIKVPRSLQARSRVSRPPQVVPKKAPQKKVVSKSQVQPPVSTKPNRTRTARVPGEEEWRKSWGQAHPWKHKPESPAKAPQVRKTSRRPLPLARSHKEDPLKDPDRFAPAISKQKTRKSKVQIKRTVRKTRKTRVGTTAGKKDSSTSPTHSSLADLPPLPGQDPPPPIFQPKPSKQQPTPKPVARSPKPTKRVVATPAPMPKPVAATPVPSVKKAVVATKVPAPSPVPPSESVHLQELPAGAEEGNVFTPRQSSGRTPMAQRPTRPNAFSPPAVPAQVPGQVHPGPVVHRGDSHPYVGLPRPGTPMLAPGMHTMPPMRGRFPHRASRPMPQGMHAGAGNAFTAQATPRPIPSNMRNPQMMSNAFAGPGYPRVAMHTPAYPRRPFNPVMQVPAHQAPIPVLGSAGSATPSQLLFILRDELLPSRREWAADQLAALDWHKHPEVVRGLMTAARKDPAASVRAACVRGLEQMHVNTVPVVQAIQSLKEDSDQRVRQAAHSALSTLAPQGDK